MYIAKKFGPRHFTTKQEIKMELIIFSRDISKILERDFNVEGNW
jgi:hypothetical protein